MRKIAIYGKGGIGKSTTTSHLAAALAEHYTVMQIGCDPKADSTLHLLEGRKIPSVLDLCRDNENTVTLNDLVHQGYNGVWCVESGGPIPGVGCAGLGIITAFEKLKTLQAFETLQPDIVLYDVLGDVVCGGFAMPIRDGFAEDIFIVTSGEKMSLFAAYNIYAAVQQYARRGYAQCTGLILNQRNIDGEYDEVAALAQEMNVPIIQSIPRSPWIQRAEAQGQTVIQAFPDSDMAQTYRELAQRIILACDAAEAGRQRQNPTAHRNRKVRR